jgi:gliding motility-associated lipoprotein GldD
MKRGTRAWIRTTRAAAFLLMLTLTACSEDPVPKPRGWPRLDLPEKSYRDWSVPDAFSASVPTYCEPLERTGSAEARWFNLRFPGQKATVHLTYRRIANDLDTLIHDAHDIKGKHQVMASRIRSERLLRDSARVFGTLFDVEGNVASPMVFYLTDSSAHFLYGALYFDARPNADSLAPVTTRLREDLRRLVGTLRWE